jgi:hypothetical protein
VSVREVRERSRTKEEDTVANNKELSRIKGTLLVAIAIEARGNKTISQLIVTREQHQI